MVSLFFAADHSGARVTSIVGRYLTINSASALTRIYRVARGSVQRTEKTSPARPLYAMSPSVSLWQRAIPLSILPCSSEIYSSLSWLAIPFLPSCDVHVREAEKSTPARLFVPGPRYYFANKSPARFGAVSSDTAGNATPFYESELHLIYRYSANDGCKASRATFFLIRNFPSRMVVQCTHSCCIFIFD